MNFFSQWLNRFGLSPTEWPQEVAHHVQALPFINPEKATALLEFLFGEVPAIVALCDAPQTALLANAYGWCCLAFWQCESVFPALPENYAQYLQAALATPLSDHDESAMVLARLIVEFNAGGGQCGFNKLILEDAATIRESERLNYEGRYEVYLKTQAKYDEYVYFLEHSPDFQAEWQLIKTTYAYFLANKRVLRRSPIPERNWLRGGATGAEFHRPWAQFKAIFDFFCWKYYLWGMDGDQPMLLKPSAVCTPHGTQIFIPGYLSFDAKRDLDFTQIGKLHRARGIPRQGPQRSRDRQEVDDSRRKARAADAEARSLGKKGDERYAYICKKAGILDSGDYRQLRELLSGRKKIRKQ